MAISIQIIQGDITTLDVDAIVNAANSSLMGGGGVDGAIHRAGGAQILEECRAIRAKYGRLQTGRAVITSAGNLSAKYVIHTVGPIWNNGNSEENTKLKNCYQNALQLAIENGCKTVAFPNISTGVYGYPKNKAAEIAVAEVRKTLVSTPGIQQVLFVCFDRENYSLYQDEIKR